MRRNRRVKIVATLGPASTNEETMRRLFEAGADVFRVNMSHANHDNLREIHGIVRKLEIEFGRLRKTDALGKPGQNPRDAHLVDRLASLAGTGVADVNDACRVDLEHQTRGGHGLARSAAHDRKPAVLSPGLPARHRGVESVHTEPFRGVGDPTRDCR